MKTKLHDSKSHAQYSVSSFFFILVIIVMEKQAFEIMEKWTRKKNFSRNELKRIYT